MKKPSKKKPLSLEVHDHGFIKRIFSGTVATIRLRDRKDLDRYNYNDRYANKVDNTALRLSRQKGGKVQITNPRGKPITWADAFSNERKRGAKLKTLSVDQTY